MLLAGIYMVKGWTKSTADSSGDEICKFDQTGAGAALFGCGAW
jgi:hypothetical protein